MAFQSTTINPATTSPAVDIGKIKNDLAQLKGVIGGTPDGDIPSVWATPGSVLAQTANAATTGGTSTAYTLTPGTAIASYAAGQTFWVTFHTASGAAPTLQISGVASPPNLVKQDNTGAYVNIGASEIPSNHRSRVTLISTTQALVEDMPPPVTSSLPTQTNNNGKFLKTDGSSATWVNQNPPVRQTVLSGPVDTNGLPSFGGSTGSTTVTASGTIIATAANGQDITGAVNRTGSKTNPSWTSLSTNGTMYLGVTVNADGTLTEFSTTLQPTYRWGGADVVTANQRTFNIQEMQMKVGNGSTAAQAYDVFVGEVTVAGGVVTAITWYALQGRYDSPFTNTLPSGSTNTTVNHNIGCYPESCELELENITTEFSFAVGDRLKTHHTNNGASVPLAFSYTYKSATFTTGNTNAFVSTNRSSFTNQALTAANWKYRVTCKRGW